MALEEARNKVESVLTVPLDVLEDVLKTALELEAMAVAAHELIIEEVANVGLSVFDVSMLFQAELE